MQKLQMSAKSETVMASLKRRVIPVVSHGSCPECGVIFSNSAEKSRHPSKCTRAQASRSWPFCDAFSASVGDGQSRPLKRMRQRSASLPDINMSVSFSDQSPASPVPDEWSSPRARADSKDQKDEKEDSLDALMNSVPADLRQQAELLRDHMGGVRAFLSDLDSTSPVNSVTEFMLFLVFRCHSPMPRQKQQLLLHILNHPKFRLADVPTHIRRFDDIEVAVPLVRPEPFHATQTVTKRVSAGSADAVGARPTVKTESVTLYYLSPLKKLEQLMADPQRRCLVMALTSSITLQTVLPLSRARQRCDRFLSIWRFLGQSPCAGAPVVQRKFVCLDSRPTVPRGANSPNERARQSNRQSREVHVRARPAPRRQGCKGR